MYFYTPWTVRTREIETHSLVKRMCRLMGRYINLPRGGVVPEEHDILPRRHPGQRRWLHLKQHDVPHRRPQSNGYMAYAGGSVFHIVGSIGAPAKYPRLATVVVVDVVDLYLV